MREVARQARAAGIEVPAELFEWAAAEGRELVRAQARRRLAPPLPQAEGLPTALRCGVRHWSAPHLVAGFAGLRPVLPELAVRRESGAASVLVRTGRWHCPAGAACAWKLCEPAGA